MRLALALLMSVFVAASGCSKDKKPEEASTPTGPVMDENTLGDSDSGKAMGLQTINFPYDSFVLDGEAKGKLKANAEILKDKGSVKVQLEGHCDSRGGIQYNIALGEKRANAVMKYLGDLGVSADRATTISYGKERLLDPGMSEEAHAKNRRVNFVITSR
jgi:peptidoglycan-associated lipoprotein